MNPLDLDSYLRSQSHLIDDDRWFREVVERGSYCLICGLTDDPMFMDSHHIAGRSNDPLTIPICARCHRHLTCKQRSWPEGWATPNNPRAITMALMLRGISDVLFLASRKLRALSDEMLGALKREQ